LTRLFPWVWTREGGRLTTTISFELILERERQMEGERGTVCVTGGTGYLASWLIMKLLEQGYSVNTTVRPHPGKFSIYIYIFFVFFFHFFWIFVLPILSFNIRIIKN
jgi:hypothetical protein